MKIWLAGRYIAKTQQGIVWGLKGIFIDQDDVTGEDRAISACNDEFDFVAPLDTNTPPAMDDTNVMAGAFYPMVLDFDREDIRNA